MASWYKILQGSNHQTNKWFYKDQLGIDLETILNNINQIEVYLELPRSTWHQDYQNPKFSDEPHMVIHPGGNTSEKSYLKERIDFLRNSVGIQPFNWQHSPSQDLWGSKNPRTIINLKHIMELKEAIGHLVGNQSTDITITLKKYTQLINQDGTSITYSSTTENENQVSFSVSYVSFLLNNINGSKSISRGYSRNAWGSLEIIDGGLSENDTVGEYDIRRNIVGIKIESETNGDINPQGLEIFEQENLNVIGFYNKSGGTLKYKENNSVSVVQGNSIIDASKIITKRKYGDVRLISGHPIAYYLDEYAINENEQIEDEYVPMGNFTSELLSSSNFPDGSEGEEGFTYYYLSYPIEPEAYLDYRDSLKSTYYTTNRDIIETEYTNTISSDFTPIFNNMVSAINQMISQGYMQNLIAAGGGITFNGSASIWMQMYGPYAGYTYTITDNLNDLNWLYWNEYREPDWYPYQS